MQLEDDSPLAITAYCDADDTQANENQNANKRNHRESQHTPAPDRKRLRSTLICSDCQSKNAVIRNQATEIESLQAKLDAQLDENRDLKRTNDKLESDLQASQERQLSQQLSQVSVDNTVRHQLFEVTTNGAVLRYSNKMMCLGLILMTLCNTSARSVPSIIKHILTAAGITPSIVPTFCFFP